MFCAGLFSIADLLGPDHLGPTAFSSDRSGSELRSLLALARIVNSRSAGLPGMDAPRSLCTPAHNATVTACVYDTALRSHISSHCIFGSQASLAAHPVVGQFQPSTRCHPEEAESFASRRAPDE